MTNRMVDKLISGHGPPTERTVNTYSELKSDPKKIKWLTIYDRTLINKLVADESMIDNIIEYLDVTLLTDEQKRQLVDVDPKILPFLKVANSDWFVQKSIELINDDKYEKIIKSMVKQGQISYYAMTALIEAKPDVIEYISDPPNRLLNFIRSYYPKYASKFIGNKDELY